MRFSDLFKGFNDKPETIEEAEENANQLNRNVVKKQNEEKKDEVDKGIFGWLSK